ncbi:ATP-dependent helicase DCL-2 [Coniella lustricola]|uniref:ATP-dependent helicase DCL-2 n=1 Tax=Coniella lustricola TaxID=2025994 RepID=A0A2T3ABJ8_9PEZI|nr:ATP-dependent helicase DCL-2 [Coniella lustricola]
MVKSNYDRPVAARAYQTEMLDASLKENIICSMDTGSGKTQVAILRMKAELERMSDGKVIWFLAPTVELCSQQYRVVMAQIPSVQAKLITGSERVDVWSSSTWSTALINVKIIITTPQVLLDALLNAFIRMSSLALLVFDEVHRCSRNHPYRRIMKEFYWETKDNCEPVPHILGLTASPVTSSDITTVSTLEAILDAVCRSPTLHREELLLHSHRPSLFTVPFEAEPQLSYEDFSPSMQKLTSARNNLNIMEDPYVLHLAAQKTESSYRKLEKAVLKRQTYVQDTMKAFCRRSLGIASELGAWAADWYMYKAIRHFLESIAKQGAHSENYMDSEVVYLARIFQDADIGPPPPMLADSQLSDKVQRLIEALLKHDKDAKAICFVLERSTTVVLEHILSTHPEVSKKFKIGSMIGTSFVPGVKQNFLDLVSTSAQTALEDFRKGTKNLLVSTSVLEEGIDVPACNLVICFSKPSELRSFIQRRGRARMKDSHYYIFVDNDDETGSANWENLEAQMKRQYEDGKREIQILEAVDDPSDLVYPEIRVESTGARLTIHDAKSRLHQFVSTLVSRRYVESKPEYLIETAQAGSRPGEPPHLRATVLLPVSVPQNLRRVTGLKMWTSEKIACMDAAFQAYQALWKAELIDDHLLPLRTRLERDIETRSGTMPVRPLYNPWFDMAKEKCDGNTVFSRRTLRMLGQNGASTLEFELTVPGALPAVEPLIVWWDHETRLTLSIDTDTVISDAGGHEDAADYVMEDLLDHTPVLLALAYSHRRMEIKEDCLVRLTAKSKDFSIHQVGETLFAPSQVSASGLEYLVRAQVHEQHPYYFHAFLPFKPPRDSVQKTYKGFEDDPVDAAYLSVTKWPRQAGYFHRPLPPAQTPNAKPYSRVLLASNTKVDSIPLKYAEFGLLIPALIHHIELYLVATELSSTILAPLKLSNISMLVEAICATGARMPKNYERMEFLGDSILKTCITLNVAATNLHHAEGILSLLKDRLVSNARLCRAACDSGLDQFIVTQPLVTKGWRPPYLSELVDPLRKPTPKRIMASKTLADVVEALIGLCYMEGGLTKAIDCIQLLVPESRPKLFQQVRNILAAAAEPKGMALPASLQPLEELIEYRFEEKALLVEAVTHPSYNLSTTATCFERLEFIGDAILDYVVVHELFSVDPALENWQMHLLRTALVNADILAFFTMEWNFKEQRFDVSLSDTEGEEPSDGYSRTRSPSLAEKQVSIPLWSFMRQSSPELVTERELTQIRHKALRESILEAMHSGTHYPWALFARLRAQKFYSDFFEALVGAVWVDSGPDFEACQEFLTRSGLLRYLRRLLQDKVHVLHPKEELGRLAGNETVAYVVRQEESSAGGNEWLCQVEVGGQLVAEENGCLFKEEARVKAATRACEMIKDLRAKESESVFQHRL